LKAFVIIGLDLSLIIFFLRFHKAIFVFAIALSSFLTTESLILDCTYSVRNLWRINSLYTCTARVVFVGDPRYVTEVSINHMAGRNHSNVVGLLIENQPMGFIPGNISNFFPNLEAMSINNCGLQELTSEAINGLSNLRQLHLNPNQITEIGNNLFEGNPRLRFITFSRNPIRHIAHNVFDHLTELETLDMLTATCINANNGNRNAVLTFLFRLSVSCPPTFDMIFERTESKLLQGVDITHIIDNQVSERINPLTWKVFEMDQKLTMIDQRVSQLEREWRSLIGLRELLESEKPKAFYKK
jgi:Leucine rich repeat